MVYSYEEVYFELGQVDRFVLVYFHSGSETETLIGSNELMGNFKFINTEIEELEKLRGTTSLPRTEAKVKFFPAYPEKFSDAVLTILDRDGFLCSDINVIYKRDNPKENRYIKKGEKEIPNTITVKFDPTGLDIHYANLKLFGQWMKQSYTLPDFKWDQYHALLLYYEPEVAKEKELIYSNFEKKEIKPEIRCEYLKVKMEKNELSDDEYTELLALLKPIYADRHKIMIAELRRSCSNLKELYRDYPEKVRLIPRAVVNFEEDVLVYGALSIWWDLERHLHIYLRHVKEVQLGSNFITKGVFQYKFKDVRRVIKNVVENVYEEIIEHFKANPDKNYMRKNARAINYDGNFYRIEIEPSGRLLTFHPYRTLVEAEEDKEEEPIMDTAKIYQTAFNLSLFLVTYNVLEGLLSVFFGYKEESLTLFGFGIDSFIEVISGFGILQMITRIKLNPDSNRNNYERTALRITGLAFYTLVAGLLITSIYNFISGHKPETTLFGVIISSLSIIVMLIFIRAQTKVGKALNSEAILADVECTKICIYMSVVLLVASAVYAFTKFSYTDNIGALALAYLSLREGMECFEKAKSNKYCACEKH